MPTFGFKASWEVHHHKTQLWGQGGHILLTISLTLISLKTMSMTRRFEISLYPWNITNPTIDLDMYLHQLSSSTEYVDKEVKGVMGHWACGCQLCMSPAISSSWSWRFEEGGTVSLIDNLLIDHILTTNVDNVTWIIYSAPVSSMLAFTPSSYHMMLDVNGSQISGSVLCISPLLSPSCCLYGLSELWFPNSIFKAMRGSVMCHFLTTTRGVQGELKRKVSSGIGTGWIHSHHQLVKWCQVIDGILLMTVLVGWTFKKAWA